MQQQALEEAFAALVLGPGLGGREDLRRLCAELGVPPEDTEAMSASFEDLLVYRELVHGTLREALALSMPRAIRRLGARFDEYFARFLAERAPRTHYLRDVTPELLAWCAPLWAADPRVPDYIHDLAVHESLHIEVSALPALARDACSPAPLDLTRAVELSEALRLVEYEHAVHELPAAEDDSSAPERRPVALLVYRSPEHEVRYLETSPLARAILQRLLQKLPLGEALRLAAGDAGASLDATLLAGTAKLLADLAERGVVRGPAHAHGPEPHAR